MDSFCQDGKETWKQGVAHLSEISENMPKCAQDIGRNFLSELRLPLLDVSSNI